MAKQARILTSGVCDEKMQHSDPRSDAGNIEVLITF